MWEKLQHKNGKDIKRWERIKNKRIVDKLLLAWQCKHFLQATETLFATTSWREELSSEEVHQQIINGTNVPKYELPDEASEFLKYLKRNTKIQQEINKSLLFDYVKQRKIPHTAHQGEHIRTTKLY